MIIYKIKNSSLTFLSNSMEISIVFVNDILVSAVHKPHEGYSSKILRSERSSLIFEYAINAPL